MADGAAARRKIAVVTDDAAALPSGWLKREGLAVVGMPVMIDDQIFAPDSAGHDPELSRSLLVALAEGRKVTTSRPSPGQFRRVYEQLEAQGYDAIVSVHLSSELSGTVSSARIARQPIRIPVTVVDTRTVAMAQGYGVMAAWETAGSGQSLEAVVAAARTAADHKVFLYVPSLEQLKRGGRLAPSVARLGSMLQIKPLLTVRDGKLVAQEMPRTAVKAKARFLHLAGEALQAERDGPSGGTAAGGEVLELVVHHLADPDAAHHLAAELVETYAATAEVTAASAAKAQVIEVPPVLAAHVGVGVRAVIVRHRG